MNHQLTLYMYFYILLKKVVDHLFIYSFYIYLHIWSGDGVHLDVSFIYIFQPFVQSWEFSFLLYN